jgi:plasmid stability protein
MVMNILIEDLDEETVEKLREQAAGKQRSLEADIKVILEETVEQREQWKNWRERTRRIADEIRQSGQKFPDTTELLREDRER